MDEYIQLPLTLQIRGLCECGCGQPAPISPYSHRGFGYIKGQPRRFIHGHNRPRGINTAASFWALVEASAGPDACWPWQGNRGESGHGQLSWQSKHYSAHRLAWYLTNGEIPAGKVIRHTCDNPPCCNPKHLIPGTYKDNTQDAVSRGRFPRGEAHPSHKLTWEQVREIRRLHAAGTAQRELARRYGIDRNLVRRIIRGFTWKE